MADFVKLATTAKRLIDKNGRTVTVTQQAKTAADPSKPWRTTSTPVAASVTGKGVFVDPSEFTLGIQMMNEDDTKRFEKFCLFAANNDGGNALESFDLIVDGSTNWRIMRTQVLKPADTKLLYIFEVKR